MAKISVFEFTNLIGFGSKYEVALSGDGDVAPIFFAFTKTAWKEKAEFVAKALKAYAATDEGRSEVESLVTQAETHRG